MPIEIDGLAATPVPRNDGGVETRHERREPGPDAAGARLPATDTVNLTGAAERLRRLEERVSSLPIVDERRIETIREAIESGTYEVDAVRTAEKLLAIEQDLPET